MEHILFRMVSLKRKICAIENEVHDRLGAITTTQKIYRILEIVVRLVLLQMAKAILRRVRSLIPYMLCNLKLLFCAGLTKFNICSLQDYKVFESRIFKSSLF